MGNKLYAASENKKENEYGYASICVSEGSKNTAIIDNQIMCRVISEQDK